MTKAQEAALKEEIKELKHDLKEAKHDLKEAETLEQEVERLRTDNARMKAEIKGFKHEATKQPKVNADEVERLKQAEAEREWRLSRGLTA